MNPRVTGLLASILCSLVLSTAVLRAAEPAVSLVEATAVPGTSAAPVNSDSSAMHQLREQVQLLLQGVDQSRQASETAARREAEATAARLEQIQRELALQRDRELESLRASNRMILTVAAALVAVGLLAVLLAAYFQMKTLGRLAEIASSTSAHPLGSSGIPLLAGGAFAAPQLTGGAFDSKALGALDRLERRLKHLEQTSGSNGSIPRDGDNGSHEASMSPEDSGSASPSENAMDHRRLLLGKGQALLNLGQAEKALACFEEILALEPGHADALLRKGMALERLDRDQEAIENYDRAVAKDPSLTMAYLMKGGLFNRLQRHEEALACYEKALHAQAKAPGS